jgi:hypothetical protein
MWVIYDKQKGIALIGLAVGERELYKFVSFSIIVSIFPSPRLIRANPDTA